MLAGMTYQECVDAGRDGEEFAVSLLEAELAGTGLDVRWMRLESYNSPFDIEIHEQGQPVVGIENKDATHGATGIWQKRPAIRRKQRYATKHGIKKVLTTVTIRDKQLIGFDEGLKSQRITDFDFRKEELVKEILATRRMGA